MREILLPNIQVDNSKEKIKLDNYEKVQAYKRMAIAIGTGFDTADFFEIGMFFIASILATSNNMEFCKDIRGKSERWLEVEEKMIRDGVYNEYC